MARDDEHDGSHRPPPDLATVPLGPGRARPAPASDANGVELAEAAKEGAPSCSAVAPALAELTATTSEQAGRYVSVDPATGALTASEGEGELARGGMGRVICVFDRYTAREVALKERLSEESSAGAARFLQEARVTAQLEHPSIVPIYEIGRRESGRLYYTMRRVHGKTLADCLAECETLSERVELLPHFLSQAMLMIGASGVARYGLFTGRTEAVVAPPAADRIHVSTDAQLLLLADQVSTRTAATLLPVNARLLGPSSTWRDDIERLTGYDLREQGPFPTHIRREAH